MTEVVLEEGPEMTVTYYSSSFLDVLLKCLFTQAETGSNHSLEMSKRNGDRGKEVSGSIYDSGA
jgi:hypothetical protein